jgi:pimeloyl-ACP methyl ester carboxylesterase
MPDTLTFNTTAQVRISASSFGDPNNKPVLLLHGAGQTRHAWHAAATALADNGWRAVSLDARGHGDSSWCPDGDYSIEQFIHDLKFVVDTMAQQNGQRPAVVGASLGGITALLAQGESSQALFSALVLVDITPRIDEGGVAKILGFMRRHQDGFATLQDAADAVAQYQSHRSRANKSVDGLRKNLRLVDGRYYWHWDPKLLNHVSRLDVEAVERQREAAKKLSLPVLLVHGQMSEIVNDETAREFLQLVPHASYANVSNAAHMVAGDNNDLFASAVSEFLQNALD